MRAVIPLVAMVGACVFTPGDVPKPIMQIDAAPVVHDAADPTGDGSGSGSGTGTDAPGATCTNYPVHNGPSRYRLTQGAMLTWQGAQDDCASDGGHLVVINDAAEDMFLTSSYTGGYGWIGLHDPAANNQYVWVDGTPMGFSNFAGGGVPGDGSHDCVDKRFDTGTWAIYFCTYKQAGICECS